MAGYVQKRYVVTVKDLNDKKELIEVFKIISKPTMAKNLFNMKDVDVVFDDINNFTHFSLVTSYYALAMKLGIIIDRYPNISIVSVKNVEDDLELEKEL